MCGIVGYIGKRAASDVLLDGLHRMEYRGYDSAGIACLSDGKIGLVKSKGKIQTLRDKVDTDLDAASKAACTGIGHTRWATHGAPTDANAHPHLDASGRFALVHNGIIEN